MTTTVVSTIGTGGDYSTLQAWEDAAPANLVTADQIWRGECLNQAFSSASNLLTISGSTSDATRYKILTAAAGASFADNPAAGLRFNSSNGASITCTAANTQAVVVAEAYARLSRMQFLNSGSSGYSFDGPPVSIAADATISADHCIFECTRASSPIAAGSNVVYNCLFVLRNGGTAMQAEGGGAAYNCTYISLVSGASGIRKNYSGTSQITNCAFFNISSLAVGSGSGGVNFTTCITDAGSPPSGCTTVAYDTSTGSGFESITGPGYDFRLKSTSAMIDVGTTEAVNAPDDIFGTARPQGAAYDVGAFEYVSGGGGGGFMPRPPQRLLAAVMRAAVY